MSRVGIFRLRLVILTAPYEEQCAAALGLIQAGALTSEDVEAVKLRDPFQFAFDHVIADEAQDWPQAELDLIKALYPAERLCLADGVDQLIRGGAANWEAGVSESGRTVIPLKTCLRMKANLAVFANTLADRAGLNWKVDPHREAAGGRVIILSGGLHGRLEAVQSFLAEAEQAGNKGVDALFCVPSSDKGRLCNSLEGSGYDVWDGTDENTRRDFPRSPDTLRFVHYASCRGLEGWTVFLDGLDDHWRELAMFAPDDGEAAEHAWRQLLIPLTRAMDTLVIGINQPGSAAAATLLGAARSLPDIAEVRLL